MPRKQPMLPELSPAQAEIMQIVWERGEVSAAEVVSLLEQRRSISRNTVRTLIERMEEKGWLIHRVVGRTFRYTAARKRQDSIGQKVRDVVETVCGGSPEALVSALIDYRGLDADELERIRRILQRARANRHPPGDAP